MEDSTKKYLEVSIKAIFKCRNKVLVYETTRGIRDLPGGHVEFGETIEQALKRELLEELDLRVEIEPKLIHAWQYISKDGFVHRVYIGYRIDLEELRSFKSKEYGDRIKFEWIDEKEVREKKFLPGMEQALLKALEIKE